MSTPVHPGEVVFWDGNTSQIVRRAKASDLPESMRFAPAEGGVLTPIVKVVATTLGTERHVFEYGPGERLLRSTTQILQQ